MYWTLQHVYATMLLGYLPQAKMFGLRHPMGCGPLGQTAGWVKAALAASAGDRLHEVVRTAVIRTYAVRMRMGRVHAERGRMETHGASGASEAVPRAAREL